MLTSPVQYLNALRPEGIYDEKPEESPVLCQIVKENGRMNALSLLSLMLKELQGWFNVKNNITNEQIALTAELILDSRIFYDLTLGNIKACFRSKMTAAQLYDRLDGNIIIGWLREFKSNLSDHVEQSQVARRIENTLEREPVPYSLWLDNVRCKAEAGDAEAIRQWNDHLEFMNRVRQTPTPEELHRKELEFFKFRTDYEKNKKK